MTDGSSGYEKVEVNSNDLRVEGKHIHSQFGVWTRSASVNDRRLGIDGAGNNLLLYANSAEKVRITDSGKVGINTASPRAVLDIEGNAENATLMLHSNDANANLQFSDNTGGARILNYGGDLAFRTGTNAHVFGTGDSEALRITSSGRLLLGTTDAGGNNTANHLVVSNNAGANDQAGMTIRGGTSGRSQIFFSDGNSGQDEYRGMLRYDHQDNSMQFRTNAVEKLRILSDGKVAIGGVTANSLLDVHGGDGISITHSGDTFLQSRTTGTTGTNYLEFKDSGGAAGAISYHHNGDSMRFKVAGSERLRIDSAGRVTKPNQPRFIAKLSGNATYNPSNFGNYIDFNSEEYDIGGNFTTSGTDQGLFTAPVAGLYHFTASAYGASVSWTQSWFVVNGGRKNYTDWVLNSTSDFVQNSQSIYLNAGDKVGFHPHRGGSSSYTIYANSNHTYFSGYLIG